MPRVVQCSKKPTYLDLVLRQLDQRSEPVGIYDLMAALDLPQYKVIYLIDAIKEGIKEGYIVKIIIPGESREYVGHAYCKI